MISAARFGLAIFLMLLQLASPLIHAHKNDSFENAFHLPEFEQISQLSEKKLLLFVPATHNDEVVTIGAGIKNDKRRFLADETLNVFITFPFFIATILRYLTGQFFAKTELIKLHFFNLAAPRAPPSVLFL